MVCKYARSKYNWTPNDYDLYFDYNNVPSNIPMEDGANLKNRLQEVMPLTKVVHLHLNTSTKEFTHEVMLNTGLTISNSKTSREIDFL